MSNSLLVFLLTFLFFSCDDAPIKSPICGQFAEVNASKYENANSAQFNIDTVTVDGDCLSITFGSSGCDGSSWEGNLYDSGLILESFPIQRNIRFVLKNEELCDAYFIKTFEYDISNLKADNEGIISFNLDDYDDAITYNY